jgi:hypothetical protein
MLGRLRLPIRQAIECYGKLVKDVFSEKKWIGISGPSAFKSSKLKEVIQAIVKDVTGNENELMMETQPNGDCKTYVLAWSR